MPRQKLSDDIVVDFLRRIGAGELLPGAHLPAEAALSAEFGVGRSVMREALRSLASKGFLELRQGAATVVADRSKWQLLDPVYVSVTAAESVEPDALEAIRLLKPIIASLAAARATTEDLDRLRTIAAELTSDSAQRLADLATAFDDALAQAAHNGVLAGVWATVRALTAHPAAAEQDGFWQSQILHAVESRDSDSAAAAATLSL